MKRLLAVGLTLAMVLGLTVGAFAFDAERVAAPVSGLQQIETSLGGLHPKDECWIWMDLTGYWLWIWRATWFDAGCGFKKYVDPEEGWTDCLPPYFPFNVESMKIGVHNYYNPDPLDLVIQIDIEELGEFDPTIDCFRPGPEIFRSEDLLFTLPSGFYGYLEVTFPSIWVYGPFFISWHVISDIPVCGDAQCLGWLTDAYRGAVPCWNWLYGGCMDMPYYMEFVSELGWPEGNLLFGVDGRPLWNVAVDMGSFEAVSGDRMVDLNWQSLSETNNANWTVKRDGESIATLEGQGNKETATDYSHVDRDLINGVTYSYTIEAVNYDGNIDAYGPVTATPLADGSVPGEFALSQNYPNPFNASTVIRYQLASDEHVTLKVYNIDGQQVASLVNTDQKAGNYSVHWTGKGVSSGVYFYTLSAGDFNQTKKMVFVK